MHNIGIKCRHLPIQCKADFEGDQLGFALEQKITYDSAKLEECKRENKNDTVTLSTRRWVCNVVKPVM